MEPLPATAEALELLATYGDEDLATRLAHLGETIADVVPHVDAVAVRFAAEDLTLVLVKPQDLSPRCAVQPVMRSSLALEVATPTRAVSVVTIYSEHVDVFAGSVAAIERAVGAVRGASVVDDDLTFDSCRRAELAPTHLRNLMVIDTAVGHLMGTQGFSVDEAEDWLHHVSRTSSRTPLDVAAQILAAHSQPTDD